MRLGRVKGSSRNGCGATASSSAWLADKLHKTALDIFPDVAGPAKATARIGQSNAL
jgi:hypothetical protein